MFAKARQLLLGGLSALWGGSLLGGFAFGTAEKPGAARIPKPLALLSSATLVAAAWLIRSEKRRGPAADYSHQIAKGMTWGFLGDLAMTFSVPLGMVTFGLGHIEYVRVTVAAGPARNGWNKDVRRRRYGRTRRVGGRRPAPASGSAGRRRRC